MTAVTDEQLKWLAFNGYIHNFLGSFYRHSSNCDPEDRADSIIDTFLWMLTAQGKYYWSDLEDKLLSECTSLGEFSISHIKPTIDRYCLLHYPELLV